MMGMVTYRDAEGAHLLDEIPEEYCRDLPHNEDFPVGIEPFFPCSEGMQIWTAYRDLHPEFSKWPPDDETFAPEAHAYWQHRRACCNCIED
ncbi:hypothetical protein [Granulicella arctica]|uniref:hypothetical protein n=1 Tax=Granulicella arctica TaxID=940613 RepID=UPI0021E04794|nr:hypothetical protein [Granulicella arctica]